MKHYKFLFFLGKKAVFEKEGHYYRDELLSKEEASFGMITKDYVSMEPIETADDYALVQKLVGVNKRLNYLSVVAYDKGVVTVAVEYRGEYEYIKLQDFSLEELNDSLANVLTQKITRNNPSSISKPYTVRKEDIKAAL